MTPSRINTTKPLAAIGEIAADTRAERARYRRERIESERAMREYRKWWEGSGAFSRDELEALNRELEMRT